MPNILLRLFLRTIGRLSDGVRLCFTDGPTAGTTLAYVYRNVPQGRLFIGKWIDRRFLRYVGWERARQRHAAVQSVIRQAMTDLRQEGRDVHLVDLASGPADYLKAIFSQSPPEEESVLCRDASDKSVVAGNAWVNAAGLERIRFEIGDALDRPSILALRPTPNLVLSIGLYELLNDAAMMQSIRIVAETLATDGRFILVHQVNHHDLRMVSQLFPGKDRFPPQLFLRSPKQLESALKTAGLTPLASQLCSEGWYAVLIARKDTHGCGPL